MWWTEWPSIGSAVGIAKNITVGYLCRKFCGFNEIGYLVGYYMSMAKNIFMWRNFFLWGRCSTWRNAIRIPDYARGYWDPVARSGKPEGVFWLMRSIHLATIWCRGTVPVTAWYRSSRIVITALSYSYRLIGCFWKQMDFLERKLTI